MTFPHLNSLNSWGMFLEVEDAAAVLKLICGNKVLCYRLGRAGSSRPSHLVGVECVYCCIPVPVITVDSYMVTDVISDHIACHVLTLP